MGSILTRKGSTLLSNKGYFHLWLPNLGPTQGCQNVTDCGPSASAHALWDSGKLCSLTKRDSSFPHSTPGAVPLVPMHIQELISLSQHVDKWGFLGIKICRLVGWYWLYSTNLVCLANERFWYWYGWNPYL